MRPALVASILGAAVLAASILVVRHQQAQDLDPTPDSDQARQEATETELSLDRLRARGF